jgi:hypothetical protein
LKYKLKHLLCQGLSAWISVFNHLSAHTLSSSLLLHRLGRAST